MIDFRSDTVTKPCQNMLNVMVSAEVGDDVYGDDPSVNHLETWAAERHGFEAALFCSSGTQANLLAIMSHCQRGDEYLCGQNAHNYRYEGGGAAVLGSVQPQPIQNEADGTLCLQKVAASIKPDDPHFARSRLLSIENTIGGKPLPLEYLAQARQFSIDRGLRLHLDGARVYNAAIASGVDIHEVIRHFDSVSICLSKGLGAPIGSLLLGNSRFIAQSRRWRKMLGGGMRQAGMLAAAGHYALTRNVERLADDHANAEHLCEGLSKLLGTEIQAVEQHTNMVFVTLSDCVDMINFEKYCRDCGVQISAGRNLRLVLHKDINDTDIESAISVFSNYRE
jgi:threonine aldolase